MGDGLSISFSQTSKAVASLACPKVLCVVLCAMQGAEGSILNAIRQQSSFSAEIAKSRNTPSSCVYLNTLTQRAARL